MQIRTQGWIPVCLTLTFLYAGSCSDSSTGTNPAQPQIVGTSNGHRSVTAPGLKNKDTSAQVLDLQQEVIRRLGIVELSTRTVIYKDDPLVSTQASGYFIEYADPIGALALSELEDAYNPNRKDCTVSLDDWSSNNVELFPEGKYISAGEVLSITAPAGSWPELVEHGGLPGFYEMGEHQWLNKPVPEGTMLDIPGGEFEPFSVALESIAPMAGVRLNNNDDKSLADTRQIEWSAGKNPATTVVVTLDYTSEDLSKEVYVRCVTNDSGRFTLPTQVRDVILKYGMQSTDLVVSRHTWQYLIKGDALLIVTNTAKSIKW